MDGYFNLEICGQAMSGDILLDFAARLLGFPQTPKRNDLNFRTGELRVERQVHRVKGKLVVSPPKTKASNRSVILPAPVVDVPFSEQ